MVATITRLQASSATKLAVRCPLGAEPRDRDQHLQAGAMRHDADQAGRWWYEAPGATMDRAVDLAAFRIHPGATMLWHDDVLRRWRDQAA
ncbi:hypothetical protein ABIF25_003832 [Bradyrhizobium elkanii]|uniref:hypothetical protein n=1 Tax=Bradyrhizobium elkanii TaxID=29448 RepID=UPI003515EABB